MSFPIKLELGFIFDLRYIPFILAALFGGYKVALPLWAILNIYRFYIGGPGVLESFLFSIVIFALVPYLSKKFMKQDPKTRVITATLVSSLTMIFYLITLSTFFEKLNQAFWLIAVHVIAIHIIGTIVLMILIEKIIYNMHVRKRMEDTDRLNVISELAASISHEIRNPLTVTSGFLQLLSQSKNTDDNDKRYIDFSLNELKRAEKIVSDFLSLAKPQAENMVTSNLQEEIEYVNNIMSSYANLHNVEIKTEFHNDLVTTYDKNQIHQSFINLYKNGIESMKESGGKLTIDVSPHKEMIRIQLTDNGGGMTKEEMSRLGKPYYSTKEEGTGLGLMMVYSTVNKLGGKIEVESDKGGGTTFVVMIPAMPPN